MMVNRIADMDVVVEYDVWARLTYCGISLTTVRRTSRARGM